MTSRRMIAAAALIALVAAASGWYWWTPREQVGEIALQPIKAPKR